MVKRVSHSLYKIFLLWILGVASCFAYDKVSVRVTGVQGQIAENVDAFLAPDDLPEQSTAVEADQYIRQIPQKVSKALRALGYYHPKIIINKVVKDNVLSVEVDITAGEPVKVRSLSIKVEGEGNSLEDFQEFLQGLPLAEGDIADHGKYEKIKLRLQTIAAEKGFVDAEFVQSEFRVSTERNLVWIDIIFDTGSRYYFGESLFSQDILKPRIMRRFIKHKPGQPFDIAKLLELQKALNLSGYFSFIRIEPKFDEISGYRIPVLIQVEPKKKYKYIIGLGGSTDDHLRGKLALENRRVNDRGHRFRVELKGHHRYLKSQFAYEIPFEKIATDKLVFLTAFEQEADPPEPLSDSLLYETFSFETRYVHQNWWGWEESIYLKIDRIESINIDSDDEINTIVIPGIRWSNRDADNFISTNDGYRWRTEIRGTDDMVGTTNEITFLQLELSGKRIIPFDNNRIRVIARTKVGITSMDSSLLSELPEAYQYFAGGDNSIRGYGFEQVVAQNPDVSRIDPDSKTGGRHLFTASVEVDKQIADSNWRIAAFYDFGNAVVDFGQFSSLKHAFGGGIRWLSPVGPVRLDVGFPMFEEEQDGAFFNNPSFHFTFGPDL